MAENQPTRLLPTPPPAAAEQTARAPATVGSGRLLAGRYALGEPLGSGGMATVMAAHDLVLDRPVAVKVLHERFAADPVFRSRFAREALHASSSSHPGLVTIFDSGVDEGTAFIVMERVYGRTVRELLKSQGPLPVAQAVGIAASVCEVLEVTHRAGIVHRDIKPGNLLLEDDGRVRVFDFGIAQKAGADPLTQTATVIGTASYLSPEQAAGQAAGPLSDLYAVGCVLTEMLTGAPPFDADTPVAALYRHVHDAPPLASATRAEVTPALDHVLQRLLAKAPADRPPTAAAAREELLATMSVRIGDTQVLPAATLATATTPSPRAAPLPQLPEVEPARAVNSVRRRRRTLAGVLAVLLAAAVASVLVLGALTTDSATAHGSAPGASPAPTSRAPTTAVARPSTPAAQSTLPTPPTPPTVSVPTATSFSTAVDAVRTVISAGQGAQLITASAATQLTDALNEAARSRGKGHGKSTTSKVRDLAALVGTLSDQGLVTGGAVAALDQAVVQLSGWATGSGES